MRRLGSPLQLCIALLVATAALAGAPPEQSVHFPAASDRVEIVFDAHDVPHIYARSAEDAYRALGWLHAGERLWQMELLRRRASGTLAELIGPDGLESDKLVRRLGIRRTAEEALASGLVGEDVPRWLAAYAEGVNARLAELGDKGLPDELEALGVTPAPWTPGDSAAFSKYMGWDQSGSDADLWLGMMVEKLGAEAVAELWPLDRPYELPTIPADGAVDEDGLRQAELARREPSADIAALAARRGARLDSRESSALIAQLAAAARDDRGSTFGSNNWVVSGARTQSGKPLLANDPHLGFTTPSLWYTAHLVAPTLNVIGVTFPGQPFVTLGHNDSMAWGFTNMQADAVDYFVETVNPADPNQYRHRGAWSEFETRSELIRVRGQAPVTLVVRSTVHGPTVEVGDKLVAIAWTGLRPTREALAIARLNTARGLRDFIEAMRVLDTPPMNVAYADGEGNIAMAPWGDLPLRARGHGRVPVDGASGEYDWIGLIPREAMPLAINPACGWLASANGRPAPVGYPHYLGWMWDPSYRTRRIHQLLAGSESVTTSQMRAFQLDAHDLAARAFTPLLLAVLEETPPTEPAELAARQALRGWDFEFTPDTVAGTIWNRWFALYRDAVWEDEWRSRGIQQPAGSWGYSGDNEREPALEVLEYISREKPHSIWFDDRTTPQRETRDELILAAFRAAVRELARELGPDLQAWRWGARNRFAAEQLSPLVGDASAGLELRGGPFTLNPGGKGGAVSSGASWRQVVDLGALGESVGVYPGGQSADPASPHYADQLALWARGEYTRLHFAASAETHRADAVKRRVILDPLLPERESAAPHDKSPLDPDSRKRCQTKNAASASNVSMPCCRNSVPITMCVQSASASLRDAPRRGSNR
jgi:penicillin amidase